MFKTLMAIVSLCAVSISAQAASTYTYTYNGPPFAGGTDHVSVSFTTAAPLGPSTSYLDQTSAGVTASAVSVAGPTGHPRVGFTLPITTFQVHTDATGAIDSWFLFGDLNTLAGIAPTMTGTDWQAYTVNTLVFIPGSDIGGTGLVLGHFAYDQATETAFYADCVGAPTGCTLAGNGQPYLGLYSGILNPSGTSGSPPWWQVTSDVVARQTSACAPAGADHADVAAARASIASNCPCASFDNASPTRSRKAYLACVKAQVASAALRRACVPSVQRIAMQSVCGYTPATKSVCLQRSTNGRGVKCGVKAAGACESNAETNPSILRKECQGAVCLDAADSNGDQVIDQGDDCAPLSGVCGDGIVSSEEEDCDNGTSTCVGGTNVGAPCATNAACDSGVCSGNGNRDDVPDRCRSNCSEPSCGDGVVDTGEACDDGNQISGDGCSSTCQIEP